MTLSHSRISASEKILPLPLREGVGGRGDDARKLCSTPPPSPLPQGEGEDFSPFTSYSVLDYVLSAGGRRSAQNATLPHT